MTHPLSPDTRLRRNPDAAGRALAEGEGGVVLHLETGAYHRFNRVGFMVWDALEQEATVAEIIGHMRGRFGDDPPASLEQDVMAFLAAARDRDLVQSLD